MELSVSLCAFAPLRELFPDKTFPAKAQRRKEKPVK